MCKRIFKFELQLSIYCQNIKFLRHCPKFHFFTQIVIFLVYLQLLDQLLHPYKFYRRDMSGILFFIFANCEPLRYWWYSPEKLCHNRICCPSNRSKQVQETHMAYIADTQYTRQSLNEKQHTWLHRQCHEWHVAEKVNQSTMVEVIAMQGGHEGLTHYTLSCVHPLNRTTGPLLAWSHREERCLEARCITTQISSGFIRTLPCVVCAGDVSRVSFLDLFGPVAIQLCNHFSGE